MLTLTQRRLLRQDTSGPNGLKLAIQLAGTTQVKLAAATGLTQTFISSIATGKYGRNGLPIETVRKLATFFGCSIEELFPARHVGKAA